MEQSSEPSTGPQSGQDRDANPRLSGPRGWLAFPKVFGKQPGAEMVEPPNGPFDLAEWRAARMQNEHAAQILQRCQEITMRRRRAGVPERFTLRTLADHESFPYSYDALSKGVRGVQWMSTRLWAAALNTLDELDRSTTTTSSPDTGTATRR